jgi:hypothetical protein
MKILYSSTELHDAIKDVLADPQPGDRRVALVAFVGGQAQAFLPDPNELEIVCWLQPGATDALTLDLLRKRSAKIYKSQRLHMKVYWCSRRGCVICSANASGHALGAGAQKEVGVWLPPNIVDIERLWSYANPKPINDADLKRLARLAERVPKYNASGSEASRPDFLGWQNFSGRLDWKLGWWDENAKFAKEAVKIAKRAYGVMAPEDFLAVTKEQARPHDWFLTFRLAHGTDLVWMRVDFIIEVSPSDKAAYDEDYPFQAVQANPIRAYPPPPFVLDQAFRSAFKKAIKAYGEGRIEILESLRPPKPLLDLIAEKMRTVA